MTRAALSPRYWLLLVAVLVLALSALTPTPHALAQDPTPFGSDGTVSTAVGSGNDHANAVALQGDGKIVAGGRSHNGTDEDFALVRYNADGSLDTDFGTGGKVTTDITSGSSERGWAMALQSDGKIVVAGETNTGTKDIALARYDSDGSPDTDFGTGGQTTTAIGTGTDTARAVAVQSDGKIVAGGSGTNRFGLVRYNSNGTLDTGFGSGGKVATEFPGSAYGQDMAIQPDGRIVVAGYVFNTNVDFALARYTSDGELDAPAPSTTIALEWTPALSVKGVGGGGLGCRNAVSGAECSSASVLPSDRITYTRMIYGEEYTLEYRIIEIYLTPEGELVLTLDQSVPPDFTLSVEERGASTELPVAHAVLNEGRTQARWRNTGLKWYAGRDVTLGMRRPLATLDTVYVHWDDDAQGDFTEYGIASPSSYGLRALIGESATHVKLTPRVAHAGSTVRVGRVTYDGDGNRAVSLSPVNDGEQSGAIELGGFNIIIEVEVTEEGVVKTYTLGVSKVGGL